MEEFRTKLLEMMEGTLDNAQIRKLDTVLTSLFREYSVEAKQNEVAEYDDRGDRLLNLFIASMRLEGKSESTLEQYYRAVRALFEECGKSVVDITTNDIRYHLSMYQNRRKVSKTTIDNKRRYLSAFFSWLTVEEYIVKNPMLRIKKIKQDKIIKKPFTDRDLEKIRQETGNERDKALVEFLLSTGCRVSELSGLNISDINVVKGECVVFGKGSQERIVYVSEKSLYHLDKYLTSRKDSCPALFVTKHGNRIGKNGVEKILKDIGERAGVENVHPHRFRRTFATNALNKGMPVQHVQRIMGHKSLDTTMLYCTLDDDLIRIEHKKLV